jgi:hypothetical protein
MFEIYFISFCQWACTSRSTFTFDHYLIYFINLSDPPLNRPLDLHLALALPGFAFVRTLAPDPTLASTFRSAPTPTSAPGPFCAPTRVSTPILSPVPDLHLDPPLNLLLPVNLFLPWTCSAVPFHGFVCISTLVTIFPCALLILPRTFQTCIPAPLHQNSLNNQD